MHLGKGKVFYIIDSCQSSKSVQRYSTCCQICCKNYVFSRRSLRTLACADFGVLLAQFGRVWASKLGPCWGKLGLIWVSNCDFWYLLGDVGRLALILNFNKNRLERVGDKRCRPGGLPAPFWRPPAMILEGLGAGQA